MEASEILLEAEKKMQASLEVLSSELGAIRTGRASPALVENIKVPYGGTILPLKQLAGISVLGSNTITIQPWDPSALPAINKAIMKSELGLMPSSDGKTLKITLPPLSEERRQQLVKIVRKKVEEGRVAIRNIRQWAMGELRNLEKNKEISQDALKRMLNQLQLLTNSFIARADKLGEEKEAELLEI
jgi:ribosome recycling factor